MKGKLSALWHFNGYGFYIWLSYAFFIAMCCLLAGRAWLAHRQATKDFIHKRKECS